MTPTKCCSREGPIRSANSLKGHSHSALSNASKMWCSDPSTWMKNHVSLPPMHWPLRTAALRKHSGHDLVLWTRPSQVSMSWPTDTAWGICLWALPAAFSEAGSHLSAWTTVSPDPMCHPCTAQHMDAIAPLNTRLPGQQLQVFALTDHCKQPDWAGGPHHLQTSTVA